MYLNKETLLLLFKKKKLKKLMKLKNFNLYWNREIFLSSHHR